MLFRYKNEHEFSTAVCDGLRHRGYFVTKIESGSTSQGIPDVFCCGACSEFWLEFKRYKGQSEELLNGKEAIDYRAGQIGWHLRYYACTKKKVLTVIACDDALICIAKEVPGPKIAQSETCFTFKTLFDCVDFIKDFYKVQYKKQGDK